MSDSNGQLTLEERATNFETMKHIRLVQKFLHDFVRGLLDRAEKHDLTKLESPEVELFTEFTPKLANTTYGSPEYEEFRRQMGQALAHHYDKNRHHPEHWPEVDTEEVTQLKNDIAHLELLRDRITAVSSRQVSKSTTVAANGITAAALDRVIERLRVDLAAMTSSVNRMNLLDIVEMFVDWKAATMRHNDGNMRHSIEKNRKRFGLSAQLAQIMENTVELFDI